MMAVNVSDNNMDEPDNMYGRLNRLWCGVCGYCQDCVFSEPLCLTHGRVTELTCDNDIVAIGHYDNTLLLVQLDDL